MLREAELRKRPEVLRNRTWILHHDSTPARMSLLIPEFLAKHDMTVISQLPFSPDLIPADFVFVPEVEIHSEWLSFSDYIRDKRKITMGPVRSLTKRIPGHVLELEKNVGNCV
jgi:hypothetical protein